MVRPAAARRRSPWRSARRLGGVLAAVLLGHGLLIERLAPVPPPPPGLAWRPAVTVLPPPGPRPAPPPTEVALPSVAAVPRRAPPAAPSPATATAAAATAESVQAVPTQAPPALAATGDLEPLPVYATRLPPPVRLRYRLQWLGPAGARDGEAWLDWWHDGQRYRLTLEARLAGQGAGRDGGRPWLQQHSEGRIDAAGLAPERFVDRRSARSAQAANFRRDDGPPHIAYSGSDSRQPLPAGAQDRLSWIAQLAAVAGAAEAGLPQRLSLWVSDARGWAEAWHWQPPGDEATPAGADPAWPPARWQRLPSHPDGLQLWLWPQQAEGLARHWPARLHQQRARGDPALRLELLEALPATPP